MSRSSKRLSTILRDGSSTGKEKLEVPTPYGGVYRRQNETTVQTIPPYRSNQKKANQAMLQKANQASSGTKLVMRKSNKAGKETRRVLSHVDKLLPLMHNLLGALQKDNLEPRPYQNRRESWASSPVDPRATPDFYRSKEEEEEANRPTRAQEQLTNAPAASEQVSDGPGSYVELEQPAVRRGTFVQLDPQGKEEKEEQKEKEQKEDKEDKETKQDPQAVRSATKKSNRQRRNKAKSTVDLASAPMAMGPRPPPSTFLSASIAPRPRCSLGWLYSSCSCSTPPCTNYREPWLPES